MASTFCLQVIQSTAMKVKTLKDLKTIKLFYFSDIMLWYLEEVLREMSYPELAKITGLWFLMTG